MSDARPAAASALESTRRTTRLAGLAVLILTVCALAAGGLWGFPVQDDSYMIRLLRMGGPELIRSEHPERPLMGLLIAAAVRVAGEHPLPYVAVGVLCWVLFAAETALLWVRLFPAWARAWPAAALAVVSPVIAQVQYTTLTTILPCVLPTMLVLGAALMLLARPDAPAGAGARAAAALLVAGAAALSEYALASMLAGATLLFLSRRRRGAATLAVGAGVGYALYRMLGNLSARVTTDPDLQVDVALRRQVGAPFRVVAAAWECLAGAWGRAAAALQIDVESRTTIVSAAVGVVVALCVARAWRGGEAAPDRPGDVGVRVGALIAAVLAGLLPPFLMRGFPLTRVYETRYYVPVLAFAVCATLALLLAWSRPGIAAFTLAGVVFLSADRLVAGAFAEKRLQSRLDHLGESWRPLVGEDSGAVVVVTPERNGMSLEETMAKLTYRWGFPAGGRFWMMRPDDAKTDFGPRSSCRRPESLHWGQKTIRWPWPKEKIRALLWDDSPSSEPDLEPYFRGCPSQEHGQP